MQNRLLVPATILTFLLFIAWQVSDGRTSTQAAPEGTTVGGIIDADTTWTLTDSPYIVTGNVFLAPGATLTIAAGAQVHFDGPHSIVVKPGGFLDAQGTISSPVSFTRNSTTTRWGQLRIDPGATLLSGTRK